MSDPRCEGPVVVIGGSAGALRSLLTILAALPLDFAGVVLVTLHTAEGTEGLSTILETHSRLPVREARNGEALATGVVLLAASTSHLMLQDGSVWLHKGPRENRHRPAIDPLFRSASRFYPQQTIGVLLSGMGDDGVAGLLRIQKRGGRTVIQDPKDAMYPDLPRAALSQLTPDLVLDAQQIGLALGRAEKCNPAPEIAPVNPYLEVQTRTPTAVPDSPPEPFTCPTCHGNLWETAEGEFPLYRCRIGHVFTLEALGGAVDQAVESSLWVAVRNLEEAAAVSGRLVFRAHREGFPGASKAHGQREQELLEHAQVLRDLIEGTSGISPDAPLG